MIVENEMLTEVGNVSEEVVVKCEAQSPHQKYGAMRNEFGTLLQSFSCEHLR